MLCSVRIPYKINTELGGIRIPRVPPAAMQPVAKASEYFNFCISGRAMVPNMAAVASEDPEMAAKQAQAPTVAMDSPPGR